MGGGSFPPPAIFLIVEELRAYGVRSQLSWCSVSSAYMDIG